jgi:HAD superfamily hydrolase (TIGR01459 family)
MPKTSHALQAGGLAPLAPRFDLLLCDVWGVLHNGVRAYEAAGDALMRFRAGGGSVVLVSNAPRPNAEVVRQLALLGVPREAYDAIVTSGDVTMDLMAERSGQSLHHIGPARDTPMFGDGLARVALDEADYVVCTGLLNDEIETPDDYREAIALMRARGLTMVCANPDLVVERGHQLIYCAGAIADAYAQAGGTVIYAGKPHAPIYDKALAVAAGLRGGAVARERVLAVGDAIRTDVTGARGVGIPVAFIAAGIHTAELLGGDGELAPDMVEEFLGSASAQPDFVMRNLRW